MTVRGVVQRYYNSNAGRFYTPDPMGHADLSNPTTWNQYLYANDDPVNTNDPTGTDIVSVNPFCWMTAPQAELLSAYMTCLTPGMSSAKGPAKEPGVNSAVSPTGRPDDCPTWAWRFFQNIDLYTTMATKSGTDVNFIMALSALESHWDDVHAQDLGNLFGLTHGGGNNIDFRNNQTISAQAGYQASANYWVNNYGSLVKGTTDIDQFWSDLQKGSNGAYNSATPGYNKNLDDVYQSVLQRRQDCNK